MNNKFYIDNSNYLYKKSKRVFLYITRANKSLNSNTTLEKLFLDKKINKNSIGYCKQIHSDKVLYIDNPGLYNDCDGLVARCSNKIVLQIQTADCVPIAMYDEHSQLIGLIHSGWKGSKKSICNNAVKLFLEHGALAENIRIFLGPSIKKCCYEIKNDVSEQFDDKYITRVDEQLFLDIESKIIDDLLLCGLNKNNIYTSEICSYESNECYSFRRDKNKGRMFSIIGV